jgi:hypothetical protein
MAADTTAAALSMKLLVDRKAQRVLFAEASKEVVDFLFSLLALPVATAVKLVGKDAMVGCVGNLYASVEKLDGTYVQAGAAKDALLSPTVLLPAGGASSSLLRLPEAPSPGQPQRYFRCNRSCSDYVTDASDTICPSCCNQMGTTLKYVAPSSGQQAQNGSAGEAKGFVQGIVTYTVLDDLTVTPMSTICGITLLNAFAVRDLGDLQEKTVQFGYNEVNHQCWIFFHLISIVVRSIFKVSHQRWSTCVVLVQGLAILKASLQSKTVLTDVFLGNEKSPARGHA